MQTGYLRGISFCFALFALAVTFSITGGSAEGGIIIRSSGGRIVELKSSDAKKGQKEKAKPAAAKKRESEAAKKVKLSFITPGLEKLEGTWEVVEESDGKLTLVRPEPKRTVPEKTAGKTDTADTKPKEPPMKASAKRAGFVLKVIDGRIIPKSSGNRTEIVAVVKPQPEKVEAQPAPARKGPVMVKKEAAVKPPPLKIAKPKRKPAIASVKKEEPKPKTIPVGKKRRPPAKKHPAVTAGHHAAASKIVAKTAATVVAAVEKVSKPAPIVVAAVRSTAPSPKKAGERGKWKIQLGSQEWDESSGIVAASGGRTYIAGNTRGNFDGKKNIGGSDVFVVSYDSSGRKKWTKLIGTSGEDRVLGITTDPKGNLLITGSSSGNLDGNENAGGADIFISKIGPNGKSLWTRMLGTTGSEEGISIAADSGGNAYVTGLTSGNLDGNVNAGYLDVFIAKYSHDGKKLWTSQLGTSETDMGQDIAVDRAGNVYITGSVEGNLAENQNRGGSDVFVAKYDSSGGKQWAKLIGSPGDDYGMAVAVDSRGNVYLTGDTSGDLAGNKNAGGMDTFVAAFDSGGNRLWVTLSGSAMDDNSNGIALDSSGSIYITGNTMGRMGSDANSGGTDIFYAKFDKNGGERWVKLIGSAKDDYGRGLIVDKGFNILITGSTYGNFAGANAGSSDVFLVKVPM